MPALAIGEASEQALAEGLQSPAEFRFAGQQDRQARSKNRENQPDGGHGAPFESEGKSSVVGWLSGQNSVPTGQFSHVDRPPAVPFEVE